MNSIKQVLGDISEITLRMETDYPELYRYLDENPMTLPAFGHPEITTEVLQAYLESLKELLEHHLETHKTSSSSKK